MTETNAAQEGACEALARSDAGLRVGALRKRIAQRPVVLLLGPAAAAISGIRTHVELLLASELSRRFEFAYFATGSEGRRENRLAQSGRLLASPVALLVRLLKRRPALVHINTSLLFKSFWRDFVYLIVAKLAARPVVFQIHGGSIATFAGGGRVSAIALRAALALADAVVVLSATEERHCAAFRVKRMAQIPNAIDVDAYARARPSSAGATLRLVYMGRLYFDKGVLESIEALALLRQEGVTGIEFLIAGTGAAEPMLRERIAQLDLENTVRLVGPLFGQDKAAFWRDADIFVFPSYCPEGLPYALLESLASGTPVITTRIGGIPEAVEHGVHALFVSPRDPRAVAAAIKSLLDPALRARMGRACAERARQFYGVGRFAAQFRELYETCRKD